MMTSAAARLCFMLAIALCFCGMTGTYNQALNQKTGDNISAPFFPSLINTHTGKPVKSDNCI